MIEGNGTNEVIELRREVMKRIYENERIISLLDCDEVDPEQPDTALDTCIFPYIRIPGTQEEVGTFVGVKVNRLETYDTNELFALYEVYVAIMCSYPKMVVRGQKGSRTEIIAAEVEKTFNWNHEFGFEFHLDSVTEDPATDDYYGCLLVFSALRSNTLYNGRKRFDRRIRND